MKAYQDIPIAIDFDGTCVSHEYPRVGREIGAPKVLRRLVMEGAQLILFTMRSDKELQDAVRWFAKHGIPLAGVNRNPDQDEWTSSPKAYANIYIDDAALGAPIRPGLPGERPFIDWPKAEVMLFGNRSHG